MTDINAILLQNRGVLAISGGDAREFLQGLVSNDLSRVSSTQAIYAALLTPQGRYLHDFFIVEKDGVFFLDAFGGYEAFREMEESTEFENFTYVWDQHHYNPINGDITCLIHFTFPDGSKIKRAFSYHWRLWTLPELQELLIETGFQRVLVYWEGTDEKTGEGNGEYLSTKVGEADAGWICYLSAEK